MQYKLLIYRPPKKIDIFLGFFIHLRKLLIKCVSNIYREIVVHIKDTQLEKI